MPESEVIVTVRTPIQERAAQTAAVKTEPAPTPPVIKKELSFVGFLLSVLFGTAFGMSLSLFVIYKSDSTNVVLYRDNEKLVWVRTDEPWKDKPQLPRGPLQINGKIERLEPGTAVEFRPSSMNVYRITFFVPGAKNEPTMGLEIQTDSPLLSGNEAKIERGTLEKRSEYAEDGSGKQIGEARAVLGPEFRVPKLIPPPPSSVPPSK